LGGDSTHDGHGSGEPTEAGRRDFLRRLSLAGAGLAAGGADAALAGAARLRLPPRGLSPVVPFPAFGVSPESAPRPPGPGDLRGRSGRRRAEIRGISPEPRD
jgi:hypothetical protein